MQDEVGPPSIIFIIESFNKNRDYPYENSSPTNNERHPCMCVYSHIIIPHIREVEKVGSCFYPKG